MKERNHSNVVFVIMNLHQNMDEGHIAIIHEGKTPFKCDICSTSFGYKFHLNKHIARVHEGRNEFKCEMCTANFVKKYNLFKHVETMHEEKKQF